MQTKRFNYSKLSWVPVDITSFPENLNQMGMEWVRYQSTTTDHVKVVMRDTDANMTIAITFYENMASADAAIAKFDR